MVEGMSGTDELIHTLQTGNFIERMNVINQININKDEKAVAPLVFMLNHGTTLQSAVIDALAGMGDVAVGPILECWPALYIDTQKCLTYILMAIGSEKAVDALITLMNDMENHARPDAARALGLAGGKRATEPLIKALKDDNYALRNAAYKALDEVDSSDIDLAMIIREVETQCIINEMGTLDVIRTISEKGFEEPASITVTVGGAMKQKLMLLTRGHKSEADSVRYPESQLRFAIYIWRMMKIARKKMA